jgi:hypothetical protein
MTALNALIRGLDPAAMMAALRFDPELWQVRVMRSTGALVLLLCARQAGKSTTDAALAPHTVLYGPESLVLLVSPSLRQSGELLRKVHGFYQVLGRPVAAEKDTAVTLALVNGSRVVCLPANPEKIRGFSPVTLLVVDGAAQPSVIPFRSITRRYRWPSEAHPARGAR